MRTLFRFLFIASCGLAASLPVAASPTAVEYFHSGYGHYFVTASPQEIAALDAGALPRVDPHRGVVRRARSSAPPGRPTSAASGAGQTFAPRSSHFYTSDRRGVRASEAATRPGLRG